MTGQLGQQYGNYRLIRLLGQGGFAEVYLAEHIHLESLAAIKLLQVVLLNEHRASFLTEARRLAKLKNTHIVRLLDYGIQGDVPFLVMEFAPNGSMRAKHPKGTQVPLETVVMYVDQIADALQYIHEQKLVHRDIKPENILLGANQEVLVSDLGIAVVAHGTGSIVPQGQAGTLTYMAPEQILEMPRPASDQYSLGIVVYEWLCGNRPFQGSFSELYNQHLSVPPPSLREKIPELPSSVEEVVLTTLAKDPQKRFSSVRAFATSLRQASQNEQLHPPVSAFPGREANLADPHQRSSTNAAEEQATIMMHSLSRVLPEEIDTTQTVVSELKSMNQVRSETDSEPTLFTHNQFHNGHAEKVTAPLAELARGTQDYVAMQQHNMVDSRDFRRPELHEHPTATRGGGSRPPRKTKGFLLFAALILLVAIIGASILLYLRNFVSSTPASVATRIVSISKDLKDTYIIFAVTGKPDASQRQVQARLLSYSLPSQSRAVRVTGLKTIPGIQAAGTLIFYNGSLEPKTIKAGTIIKGNDGVQVVNDKQVTIPGVNFRTTPPAEGFVSVSAHAMNVGMSGNIKALDIRTTCCIANDYILVENLTPFKGGKDEQQISVVQQNDIDGVVGPLTQQAKTSLQSQVRPDEQWANPPQCTSKETTNHSVGDRATSVNVTASVICIGEVYDQRATETLAENLLRSEAIKSLGNGYTLMDKIVTKITQVMVTDTKKGTLLLIVEAEGVWVPGHLSFLHSSST